MTLAEQLRFMFTTLHSGSVNLALHVASIPFIVWGLMQRRVSLIALGASLEVLGHAYNYLVRFNPEQRRKATRVLPVQAGLSFIVFTLLLKLFRWF
jgi:hypothetical protein